MNSLMILMLRQIQTLTNFETPTLPQNTFDNVNCVYTFRKYTQCLPYWDISTKLAFCSNYFVTSRTIIYNLEYPVYQETMLYVYIN